MIGVGYKISSCKYPRLELHVHRNRGAGCPPRLQDKGQKRGVERLTASGLCHEQNGPARLFLLNVLLDVILLTYALVT